MEMYTDLKGFLTGLAENKNLFNDRIEVRGKVLSSEEAIGNPKRRDFPLLKGKEKLLEADYKGSKGQAFTDSPYGFAGKLRDFLEMPMQSNFEKAAFIAVLNAVMRHFGLIEGTVHCKNEEPSICAEKLVRYLKEKYGCARIA
jgi:hypothetical protein